MKDLMKMIMKKKEGAEEMTPEEIQAKMDVIQELLELAGESQGKGLAGKLQKVSVMAPDKESLLEGMNKAQDLVEQAPEGMEEEHSESPEEKLMEKMKPEMEESEPEHDEDEVMSFEERRKRKMMDKMKEDNE